MLHASGPRVTTTIQCPTILNYHTSSHPILRAHANATKQPGCRVRCCKPRRWVLQLQLDGPRAQGPGPDPTKQRASSGANSLIAAFLH